MCRSRAVGRASTAMATARSWALSFHAHDACLVRKLPSPHLQHVSHLLEDAGDHPRQPADQQPVGPCSAVAPRRQVPRGCDSGAEGHVLRLIDGQPGVAVGLQRSQGLPPGSKDRNKRMGACIRNVSITPPESTAQQALDWTGTVVGHRTCPWCLLCEWCQCEGMGQRLQLLRCSQPQEHGWCVQAGAQLRGV